MINHAGVIFLFPCNIAQLLEDEVKFEALQQQVPPNAELVSM